MAAEDFMESEVGFAVAATALVLSPRVRAVVRRGLVLGVAGVMRGADAVGNAAKNVEREAQAEAGSDDAGDQGTTGTGRSGGRSRGRAAGTETGS